jgi:hypothetical protein
MGRWLDGAFEMLGVQAHEVKAVKAASGCFTLVRA